VVQEWAIRALSESERAQVTQLPRTGRVHIRVNDDSYQTPSIWSDSALSRHPELTALRRQYDLRSRCKRLRGAC